MNDFSKQWEMLCECVATGKVFNGYLFYGQDEVFDVALDFAKALNSPNPAKEDLLTKKFLQLSSVEQIAIPNIKIVEPMVEDNKGREKSGKEILIEQIRDVGIFVSSTSLNGGYKAVIIKQAHCLNVEAQNAFLKILEEPKGKTLFVLLTPYPQRLLPTVLSRCMKIFFPFKNEGEKIAKAKDFEKIIKSNLAERFAYAQSIAKDKDADKAGQYEILKQELFDWLSYLRELMLKTEKLKAKEKTAKAARLIRKLQQAIVLLETTNTNQKLNFENFLIDL